MNLAVSTNMAMLFSPAPYLRTRPPTLVSTVLLLLLAFGSRPTAAAQSPQLGDLSSCGLTCLLGGIARSSCNSTDIACQCASKSLLDSVTECLTANCTMQESLDVSRFTAAECKLSHASRSTQVTLVMSALWAASALFVVLRGISKMISRTFCTEDHVIIAAVVLAAAPVACILYMAELGFGSHVWDLPDGVLLQILRLFYVAEVIYVVSLALTKVSIVAMYLRIFRAYPPFQLACHAALLFIIVPSLVLTLLTVFSCRPVAYFWDRDLRGQCLDVSSLAYATSALAVAQDLALVALPVGMLWGLNMTRKKKAFIGLMFAVGSLGLVATVVRLTTLHVFGSLADPTWDYTPVVYWTTTELAAGIICSCLPAVRILLERSFRVFQLSADPTTGAGSRGIRMERQRRPTAEAAVADEEGWKDMGWLGDEASQRGLTLSRDEEGEISKTSFHRTHGGNVPIEIRHHPDLG